MDNVIDERLEKFIIKANKIHNNKYDYSKVIYVSYNKKVIIICQTHGEFEQTIGNHLDGKGCKPCGVEVRNKKQTDTLETFLQKAIVIHGNKYDYSKVVYIKSCIKVIIICSLHGEFQQTPNGHIGGRGCSKCGIILCTTNITKPVEEFIKQANEVHNNKYDYSKVIYSHGETPVIIICPTHGEFEQKPSYHIVGKGCQECGNESRGNKLKLSQEEFVFRANEIHNHRYDYSKSIYVKGNDKIIIICLKHGEFEQNASSHLTGCGCPKCKKSKKEIETENYLIKHKYDYIPQHKFDDCKNILCLSFDFYLPKENILIEVDGLQHEKAIDFFGGEKAFKNRVICDNIKTNYAIKKDINLIRIKYRDKVVETLNKLLN